MTTEKTPIRLTPNIGLCLLLTIIVVGILIRLIGVSELSAILGLVSSLGLVSLIMYFFKPMIIALVISKLFNSWKMTIVLVLINIIAAGILIQHLAYPPIPSSKDTKAMIEELVNEQQFSGNHELPSREIPITLKLFTYSGTTQKIELKDVSQSSDDGYVYEVELPFNGHWILTHQLIGPHSRVEDRESIGKMTFKIHVDWREMTIIVSDIAIVDSESKRDTRGSFNPIDPNHDSIKMLTEHIQNNIISEDNLSEIFRLT